MEIKIPNHVLTEEEIESMLEKAKILDRETEFSELLSAVYYCALKISEMENFSPMPRHEILNKFKCLLAICKFSSSKRISIHSIRASRIYHVSNKYKNARV